MLESVITVILGCTEFAVMLGEGNLPKINTIDVLVEAAIRKFRISKRNYDYIT